MFLNWNPLLGPEMVIPLALASAFLLLIPWIVRLRLHIFLVTLVAFSWLFAVALATQSGQIRTFDGSRLPSGYAAILSAPFERHSEYYAAVPLIERIGPRAFADTFAELDAPHSATLPTHVTTHPPAGPLFLWVLSKMTRGNVLAVSLLVTLIGALGALPTYAIAREIYGRDVARTAALLFACSPGVIIFSATSMDVVFMTVVAAAGAAVVRAPRSAGWALAAGAGTAVALCFTWGALGLGVVGVGVGLIAVRHGMALRVVATRGLLAVVGLAVTGLAIRSLTGIDLVASYGPTYYRQTHYLTYHRSAVYWLAGNVAAFLISAGIAQTSLLVSETKRRWRERRPGFETVLWAALVASTLTMAFKGETDHNWLFWVPFLAAAAAPAATSVGDLRSAAGGAMAQAVVIEALFYTGW